jgi:hypothetical protein
MITPHSLQADAAKRAAATKEGFAVSQLLQYKFDTDPPKQNSEPAPPERLELGFSTADVIVRGARLGFLAELVASHNLAALSVVAVDGQSRYSNLHPAEPWVATISVVRFDRPSGAA